MKLMGANLLVVLVAGFTSAHGSSSLGDDRCFCLGLLLTEHQRSAVPQLSSIV